MGKIDMHTHAFPDKLAVRAIETLEAGCPMKAVGDGTISGLIRSMDAANIDVSVVCTIATKPNQIEDILQWCKKIHSNRIEPLLSVHPHTKDRAKWLARFAEEGFVGIKLHPMYQDFAFDDPAMDEVYAAAAEHDLIVTAHCGQDIGFPPDDDRASPQRVRRVIDRHPDMKLLCTHMGGWRVWDQVAQHLLGQNVYLETSFSLAELGPSRAADMIARHGPDHVMLGSDWPWVSQAESLRLVEQLGVDHTTTHAILWTNAAKLLGYY